MNFRRDALDDYSDEPDFKVDPEAYVNHIAKAKEAVRIPIIGSLNGSTFGGWQRYARLIEQAGADALELNIYSVPTDPERTANDIETEYLTIVTSIKGLLKIPVAVKLSPYFTNLSRFARRLDAQGADALVLFNRFYQPDIELETLEVSPNRASQHADGDASADALDCTFVWTDWCKSRRHKWDSSRRRCAENDNGRRRCDDALLGAVAARALITFG